MSVAELKNTLAAVAFIIGTAFMIDARYELEGAEERAILSSKIYTNTIQIAAKASTIYRYDLLEAAGTLSDEDAARRVRLREEMRGLETHSQNLQSQLDAL